MCASLDTLEEVLIVEVQKIDLASRREIHEASHHIPPHCILFSSMDNSTETGSHGGEIVSQSGNLC